jgi:hypothetical protein
MIGIFNNTIGSQEPKILVNWLRTILVRTPLFKCLINGGFIWAIPQGLLIKSIAPASFAKSLCFLLSSPDRTKIRVEGCVFGITAKRRQGCEYLAVNLNQQELRWVNLLFGLTGRNWSVDQPRVRYNNRRPTCIQGYQR